MTDDTLTDTDRILIQSRKDNHNGITFGLTAMDVYLIDRRMYSAGVRRTVENVEAAVIDYDAEKRASDKRIREQIASHPARMAAFDAFQEADLDARLEGGRVARESLTPH